jgi:arylsulfatase A-like enzyme
MPSNLTRRQFLKLAALSLAATASGKNLVDLQMSLADQTPDRPNVMIILFDTLSARHLPIYGYPRNTAPNLSRFAENAIVYHNHHAAANSTMPSTSSLLTGTYPWTHRAFFGTPTKTSNEKNVFNLINQNYTNAAFTQNLLADMILHQFGDSLDRHVESDAFSLVSSPAFQSTNQLFNHDGLLATVSSEGYYFSNKNKAGSLFLSILDRLYVEGRFKSHEEQLKQTYPEGIPYIWLHNVYFTQEAVFDGLMDILDDLPAPFFSYFHLWSPHEPYRPGDKYIGAFNDEWKPEEKPIHFFGDSRMSNRQLNQLRLKYDENIAHVDAEFGRLMQYLDERGILQNSYVIVTSDHGQMFERGVHGHVTRLLYEPLLHIPLLISQPGQRGRQDICSLNSNVDLLPTILHISDLPIPEWCEGRVLAGLGGEEDLERSVFAVEAKDNPAHQPLRQATLVMLKGEFKIIRYLGYPGYRDVYELYNLSNDPEELKDLYSAEPYIAEELRVELDQKLVQLNQTYLQNDL